MAVAISSCVIELIQSAAAAAAPNEACGLLFGTIAIETASLTTNIAADPAQHFEIDPAALFAALRAERAGGPRLLGYWHSHPLGDPRPSATDRAMAAPDGRIWIIVGGGAVAGWRAPTIAGGAFRPVDLAVEPISGPLPAR